MRQMTKRRLHSLSGFTLIELLVVLAIVALLLTLAAPRYFGSIETSKEVVLRENLRTVRATLEQFHADTGRYPQSLDELVERKYLRALPIDPFTESSATWRIVAPEGAVQGAVFDLKSGAAGVARDGKPLSEL
jgi:general secretion pathway protein G